MAGVRVKSEHGVFQQSRSSSNSLGDSKAFATQVGTIQRPYHNDTQDVFG
jgi:hypothetical protein